MTCVLLRWFQILREYSFIINLLGDVRARPFQWRQTTLTPCWWQRGIVGLRSFKERKRGLTGLSAAVSECVLQEIRGSLGLNLVAFNYINQHVFVSLDQCLTVGFTVCKLLVTVALNTLLKCRKYSCLFTFKFSLFTLHTLKDFLVVNIALLNLHLLS